MLGSTAEWGCMLDSEAEHCCRLGSEAALGHYLGSVIMQGQGQQLGKATGLGRCPYRL